MKGEWVIFRLVSPSPAKAEPRTLNKVTDDYSDPEDGDALVDNRATSVTTGRDHGGDRPPARTCGNPTAAGKQGGRAKKVAGKAPPLFRNRS